MTQGEQVQALTGTLTRIESDALVESHVALVGHLVREVLARVPAHVDRDDLRSAGLVALVKASRTFEPERGVVFAAYASTRIRGALLDELRSVDWASRSVRRRSREIESARNTLAVQDGRVPDNDQVAAMLGVSVDVVERCAKDVARAGVVSLDAGEAEQSLAQLVPSVEPGPDAAVEMTERLQYLEAAIVELPERLRAVVEGYFLDERPMAELAAELGVTESRISQMRAEALVLLKDAMNAALEPAAVRPATRPTGVVARRREAYVTAVAARQVEARRTPASSYEHMSVRRARARRATLSASA
ncbi:sigma-70 family RNA polymerase sigma factor [Nocardioides dongkuii]|uniref:sigma-70 family RNA polymerase sigma factor n=1 Tax=Nocardioides dongkuii TaxID=2760089 RepID=UPI0015F81639|nr:sigma-70 family RNA polymerase sigma factor [Nocardioides dongkuii]